MKNAKQKFIVVSTEYSPHNDFLAFQWIEVFLTLDLSDNLSIRRLEEQFLDPPLDLKRDSNEDDDIGRDLLVLTFFRC